LANTRGVHRRPGIEPGRYNNVTTTLSDEEYAQLLAWIEKQPEPKPTRSEALRAMLQAVLGILEKG
jgi:cytochrome c553